MHREVLRTSLKDARSAVLQERMHREAREKCSLQFVQSAVASARFPSSLPKESLFIAAFASQQRRKADPPTKNPPGFGWIFYFFEKDMYNRIFLCYNVIRIVISISKKYFWRSLWKIKEKGGEALALLSIKAGGRTDAT